MILENERGVPVRWWEHAPNFGDLLAPWLVRKVTGKPVYAADEKEPHYMVIGSVVDKVRNGSVVWGVGSFGVENTKYLAKNAKYHAVRGPLTRNMLRTNDIDCPEVYGDPGIFVADFHPRSKVITNEVGVILRWSENDWNNKFDVPGVKKIFLKTEDIETTLDEMTSCRRIVSSSLHGLIVADAYGIPNCWLASGSPTGLEHKYYDYLIAADKVRGPQRYRMLQKDLTMSQMIDELRFDDRPHKLDLEALRSACPFWAP